MTLILSVTFLALLAQLAAILLALRLPRTGVRSWLWVLPGGIATLLGINSVAVLSLALTGGGGPHILSQILLFGASVLLLAGVAGLEPFSLALHPGGDRCRQIVDVSHAAICIADRQGRLKFTNPRMTELTGFSARELHGRTLASLATPDSFPAAEKLLSPASPAGPGTIELCLRSRNRGVVCTLACHAPLLDDQQQWVGLLFTVTDISHRRRIEDSLRHAEQFTRATLDALAQRVAILDDHGVILAVNRCWREEGLHCPISGAPGEGDNYLERLDRGAEEGEDMAAAFAAGIRAVLAGRMSEFSLEYPTAEGDRLRWYLGRVNPFLCAERLHIVLTHDDITPLKQAEEAIKHRAHHDSLTGLPNRILLEDRLDLHLVQAGRERRQVAVLFLDLDRFKIINDTLGHRAGDEMLRIAAVRLLACVRKSDTVARLGGDEFVVVLAGLEDPGDATLISRKILASLARPVTMEGRDVFTSTSIGIALFPADGQTAEALIGRADMAMYLAKEQGRNTYRFFSQELDERARRRLQKENELRRALERGEMELHFQDQVALPSGKLIGVEALVRWRHPEFGLLLPGEFLPLAEETGLIRHIDTWVLRTACEKARTWRERGLPPLRLAVNLSRRLLLDPGLPADIHRLLEETETPSGRLDLEITEDVIQANPNQACTSAEGLRSLGVRIVIDDFGTGFSSLNLLERLHVSRLKIDHTYITSLVGDSGHPALVRTIIGVARNLGIEVLAEGVETEKQRRMLTEWGCDGIQGYHLPRPAPEEAFLEVLAGAPTEFES